MSSSTTTPSAVHIVSHPVLQHKLTQLRRSTTSFPEFRRLLREIGAGIAYEVTRDLPLKEVSIETPLEKTTGLQIATKKLCVVSILRAGNGLLDGVLDVIPHARVGFIGLYRDPSSLEAVQYYYKMPRHMSQRDVVVLDPMLATGHTAVAALNRLKSEMAEKPKSIKFVCVLAAPEGVKAVAEAHPDVELYTLCVDRELSEKAYILPGLGDAGDRIYGTK